MTERLVHGHPYMPPRPLWRPGAEPDPQREEEPRRRRSPMGRVLLVLGLICIAAGAGVVGVPLYGAWERGQADRATLNDWQNGGTHNIVGALPNASPGAPPTKIECGSGASGDYALVTFESPASERYAGVAGDGTWDLLHQRSMVHYKTSAAPGAQGNVIIAFHREPDYEHIDQLGIGDTVRIQDRACHTFRYTITARWVLDPQSVTQLTSTAGHELTLVTCTPFWDDTQRIVWRAELAA